MLTLKFLHIQVALWTCINAIAVPAPTNALVNERAVNCNSVSGALKVLKGLGAPATSFCSSYLKIPATVTTTTTTTPVSTVQTIVATTTTYQAVCPAAPARRDAAAVAAALFARRAVPAAETGAVQARQAVDLAALKIFAASQLSSGCSCLSLAPKTTRTATTTAAASTTRIQNTYTICSTCVQGACNPALGGAECCVPHGYTGTCDVYTVWDGNINTACGYHN